MQKLIYDPSTHEMPMNVIAFGSGSCTTIEAILNFQKTNQPGYKITALLTNNAKSEAHRIAKQEKIHLIYNDFKQFMIEKGFNPKNKKDKQNLEMRIAFDERTKEMLLESAKQNEFHIDIIALAGYMLKLHHPLVDYFAGKIINSHPSNLSILDENGKRKYVGTNAVHDAKAAGEKETYTSIHLVREEIDAGEILAISKPLSFDEKVPAKDHQNLQKETCDYPAYCFALKELAEGNFALEDTGKELKNVFYKDNKMPYGGVQL